MPLQLRWVGEADFDRVAETRMLCYSPSSGQLQRYVDGVRKWRRARPGDFLLAERDGQPVGTSTALDLHLWIRGARLSCQGVAYVGTVKTARRLGAGEERGVASQLMSETLAEARRRGQAISALMPFRASYYEHFGYGNAEHRVDWTVPLSILPRGDFAGYRFHRPDDLPALKAMRQRECERGQCDIETDDAAWEFWMSHWPDGLVAVDQPAPGGPIEAMVFFHEQRDAARARVIVEDCYAASPEARLRVLHFLGSLKDQYTDAQLTLPSDYPLNRVLRESQVPHRQVDHPVAAAKPYTRMQIRILDHHRVLEAMHFPASTRGRANVAIRETEGDVSRFSLEIADGRATAGPTNSSADVELSDVLWASLISGDLRATTAARLGLLPPSTPIAVLSLLDTFADGPPPFCQEYF